MTLVMFLWLLGVSALAATLTLGLLVLLSQRRGHREGSVFAGAEAAGTVFLFDGDDLVDATDNARALLGLGQMLRGQRQGAWARLMAHLAPRCPGIEAAIENLPESGRVRLTGQGGDPIMVMAEWRSGLRRITISEPHSETQTMMLDAMALRAQEQELAALRRTADAAPMPICREGADGRVLWANTAYMELATNIHGPEAALAWPMPVLFRDIPPDGRLRLRLDLAGHGAEGVSEGAGSGTAPVRRAVWFDCLSVAHGDGRIVYGLPADATVRAEANLHSLLLTLTRTFAHLPVGLAVFDQQRRLQMFNPALTDLLRLPVSFLAARPSLFAFIDAMREGGILPEPRDYKKWRKKMGNLASADGEDVQETWVLADGTSYRFTARPQAEGTLALLIEDITDDMLRSRRHNAHLELAQSVIDALEDAIAVFDTSGALILSNAALSRLWGHDDAECLQGPALDALLAVWQARTAPDPVWQRLAEFVATPGQRSGWDTDLRLTDGRALRCRVEPVSGQATLLAFSLAPSPGQMQRRQQTASGIQG